MLCLKTLILVNPIIKSTSSLSVANGALELSDTIVHSNVLTYNTMLCFTSVCV